jgi:hypothetical protein
MTAVVAFLTEQARAAIEPTVAATTVSARAAMARVFERNLLLHRYFPPAATEA